jgi:hypothetical protein
MANESRRVTRQVLELAEEGIHRLGESGPELSWPWMSEAEVREFARIHGYAEDTLE